MYNRRRIMKMNGVKRFNTMTNVGRAKYIVSFHDGVQNHSDGSDFFGMKILKNKKKFNEFIRSLINDGYIEAPMDIYL